MAYPGPMLGDCGEDLAGLDNAHQKFYLEPPPLTHLIPGTEIVRPFHLYSAFGIESEEVQTMQKCHQRGEALAVYEFMQGMKDYQDKDPQAAPARVRIVYNDGGEILFTGDAAFLESVSFTAEPGRHITRIDFINSGVGLRPQNLLDVRHPKTEHKTLGFRGRGTTIAATFLESEGMHVDVYSNTRKGRAWVSRTSLKPMLEEDEEVEQDQPVLHVEGGYLDHMPFKGTVISVYNPDKTFCQTVAKAGQLFLYANPRYPNATIVAKDEAFIAAQKGQFVETKIGEGTVMCLGEGVVDTQTGNCRIIYVDGKRMNITGWLGEKSILPWAINDLSKATQSHLQIIRSHDSESYDGSAGRVLGTVMRKLADQPLLEKLITSGVSDESNNTFLEFHDFSDESIPPMHVETKNITRAVWEKHYQNTIISDNPDKVARYRQTHTAPPVILLKKGFYHFLKDAGVRTLELEIPEIDVRTFGNQTIKINPDAPDILEKLIDKVVRFDGTVDGINFKGKPCLQIKFPGTELTAEDFIGQSESGAGLIVRMGAVLAHHLDLQSTVVIVRENEVEEFTITVQKGYGSNLFQTAIHAVTYPRIHKKEYAGLKPGGIYFLLAGDALHGIGKKNTLEKLVAFFHEQAGKVKKHTLKIPIVSERVRAHKRAQRHKSGWHPDFALPTDALAYRMTIGQYSGAAGESPSDQLLGHPEAIVTPGYYTSRIGRFVFFDHRTGRISLGNHPQFQPIDIPSRKPSTFSARIPIDYFQGPRDIEVPEDHYIAGCEIHGGANDDVEFYQDHSTGIYLLQGHARRVVYYTAPYSKGVKPPWVSAPVSANDKEDILDYSLLDEEWRSFIEGMNRPPFVDISNLEKVNHVQREFTRRFQYSADTDLDAQVQGETRGAVAAQILNQASGICNIIALAAMIVLRAINVPSYVCGGYLVTPDARGGSHAYVRFHDGYRWIRYEPQKGMRIQSTQEYVQPVHLVGEELPPAPVVVQQNRFRRAVLALLLGAGLAGGAAGLFDAADGATHTPQEDETKELIPPSLELKPGWNQECPTR